MGDLGQIIFMVRCENIRCFILIHCVHGKVICLHPHSGVLHDMQGSCLLCFVLDVGVGCTEQGLYQTGFGALWCCHQPGGQRVGNKVQSRIVAKANMYNIVFIYLYCKVNMPLYCSNYNEHSNIFEVNVDLLCTFGVFCMSIHGGGIPHLLLSIKFLLFPLTGFLGFFWPKGLRAEHVPSVQIVMPSKANNICVGGL